MNVPDPALIAAVGTLIGSTIGSLFLALKAAQSAKQSATTAKQTEEATQHVKTQIDGPGTEPSLRDMVRATQEASQNQYASLHTDIVHLSDRVTDIEKAKGETIITTTLSAIHENCKLLTGDMKRARLNIHKLANHVQVKLLTQEEADAAEAIIDPKQ